MDAAVMPARAALSRNAAGVLLLLAGAVAVGWALPRIARTPWATILDVFGTIPGSAVAGLLVLWGAGLAVHTLTLCAALPGLTHRRAVMLSLTGSAVANVLPLGGAAGVALNFRMARRWGFTRAGIATYTAVTNFWDVLAKLALPVLVLPLVLGGIGGISGISGAGRLDSLLLGGSVAFPLAALTGLVLVFRPARADSGAFRRWDRVRRRCADVIAAAWARLTVGILGYTAMLFVLLWSCLHVTSAGVPLAGMLIAFCVERLATLVGLTPGGLGFVEAGLAGALLLSPGANPAGVAAGVLVYRALTFGLEIPVGGLILAAWAASTRRAATRRAAS